jgi:hypothetical protein
MLGYAATWVIGGHHVPDVAVEVSSFMKVAANILLAAGLMLVIYLALEPYVRRFWPDGVLGWTRLMSGHVRDPRVGRDVLIGCVAAVGLTLVEVAHQVLPPLIGDPTGIPSFGADVRVLIGVSTLISRLFEVAANGLFTAMLAVLCFVVLRLIFRRTPLAIAVAALLLGLVQAQDLLTSGTPIWIGAIFLACGMAIIVTLVVRYGLLVTAVALAVADTLDGVPLTAAASHWSGTTSNMTIAVVLALTLFGFYASRAGQPLFGKIADV